MYVVFNNELGPYQYYIEKIRLDIFGNFNQRCFFSAVSIFRPIFWLMTQSGCPKRVACHAGSRGRRQHAATRK